MAIIIGRTKKKEKKTRIINKFGKRRKLTVARHADGQTFLEATVLAPVAVEPDDQALAVAQAPVLDLFLNAPPEEALIHKLVSYY